MPRTPRQQSGAALLKYTLETQTVTSSSKIEGKVTFPAVNKSLLFAYLCSSTNRLDQLGVIKEEGSWQGDTVRVVGGSVLASHIQRLHCILRDGITATLAPVVK